MAVVEPKRASFTVRTPLQDVSLRPPVRVAPPAMMALTGALLLSYANVPTCVRVAVVTPSPVAVADHEKEQLYGRAKAGCGPAASRMHSPKTAAARAGQQPERDGGAPGDGDIFFCSAVRRRPQRRP